jgi:photosystem II stability/assembly factor-like uncharacterized protein
VRYLLVLAVLILAGCGEGQPADPWEVIELGTAASFRDVYFLDAENGWMVGEVGVSIPGGILARTHDGGLTWEYRTGILGKRSGSHSVDLNAVHFVDLMRGTIAAEAGTMVTTGDGGATWEKVYPVGPVYAQFRDLDFVDDSHGWAIGRLGVRRTEDGGSTWKRIDEELESAGESIDMIDRERGWMVGQFGQVWRTGDGGITWERVPALGDLGGLSGDEKPWLRSVCFVDADHGWAAGSWSEMPEFEQYDWAVIIHTRDGGRTWEHQVDGLRFQLGAIAFADLKRGWAVGYDRNAGTSHILATTDGGATWGVSRTVQGEHLRALEVGHGYVWTVGRRVYREPQRLLRLSFAEAVGQDH